MNVHGMISPGSYGAYCVCTKHIISSGSKIEAFSFGPRLTTSTHSKDFLPMFNEEMNCNFKLCYWSHSGVNSEKHYDRRKTTAHGLCAISYYV
jgi:hypothetical protein